MPEYYPYAGFVDRNSGWYTCKSCEYSPTKMPASKLLQHAYRVHGAATAEQLNRHFRDRLDNLFICAAPGHLIWDWDKKEWRAAFREELR